MSNKLKIALVVVAVAVSACASQSIPEFSTYNNEKIQLDAVAVPGLIGAEFTLNINGEEVIRAKSKPFGGSSQTFEGVWRGKPVIARATRVQKFASTYTMIDVFIGGELVETLVV
jgi:hypothetical protein